MILSFTTPSNNLFESQILETVVGKGNFILERASIDELFLDVTDHCYDMEKPAWKNHPFDNYDSEKCVTKFIAEEQLGSYPKDMDTKALKRGSRIAYGIRMSISKSLGFTLSAGISTSKTMSKLAGSMAKPNGQAIIVPLAIPFVRKKIEFSSPHYWFKALMSFILDQVLKETKIKSVRNFGGKLGEEIQRLLPFENGTIGDVAKLLSLGDLCKKLGNEKGKFVFDISRGIDKEPVKHTKGVLAKSITAFKSFSPVTIDGMKKWVNLLATDLLSRTDNDFKRNNRIPKTCSVQYYYREGA